MIGVQKYQPPAQELAEKKAYVIKEPSLTNVAADGSCLYSCLHQLYRRDIDRKMTLEGIFQRLEFTYMNQPNQFPKVSIETIRTRWGGEDEIELASVAFNVIIHAFQQVTSGGEAVRTSVSYPSEDAVKSPKNYLAWGLVLTKLNSMDDQMIHWQYLNTLKNTKQTNSACATTNAPPRRKTSSQRSESSLNNQLKTYREQQQELFKDQSRTSSMTQQPSQSSQPSQPSHPPSTSTSSTTTTDPSPFNPFLSLGDSTISPTQRFRLEMQLTTDTFRRIVMEDRQEQEDRNLAMQLANQP